MFANTYPVIHDLVLMILMLCVQIKEETGVNPVWTTTFESSDRGFNFLQGVSILSFQCKCLSDWAYFQIFSENRTLLVRIRS